MQTHVAMQVRVPKAKRAEFLEIVKEHMPVNPKTLRALPKNPALPEVRTYILRHVSVPSPADLIARTFESRRWHYQTRPDSEARTDDYSDLHDAIALFLNPKR